MNGMVDVPTVECDKSRNNYTRCKCDLAGNSRNMLIAELKFICKQVKGICLDCIKRDALGDLRVCRINHNSEGRLVA
jgi:hypothetical protein